MWKPSPFHVSRRRVLRAPRRLCRVRGRPVKPGAVWRFLGRASVVLLVWAPGQAARWGQLVGHAPQHALQLLAILAAQEALAAARFDYDLIVPGGRWGVIFDQDSAQQAAAPFGVPDGHARA